MSPAAQLVCLHASSGGCIILSTTTPESVRNNPCTACCAPAAGLGYCMATEFLKAGDNVVICG